MPIHFEELNSNLYADSPNPVYASQQREIALENTTHGLRLV